MLQELSNLPTVMIKPADQAASVCKLKITLEGSSPSIWRRIVIPAAGTLQDLHEAIQCVMPWENYHLHEFLVGDEHYGVPDPEYGDTMLDETTVTLGEIFTEYADGITYIYDFGDGWQHKIECEGIDPGEVEVGSCAVCVDGEMACPPEDSGALFGYYRKLKILQEPSHDEYELIKEWMPPGFDPHAFDVAEANFLLALGVFTDDDFDGVGDDLHDIFATTCGWCRPEIEDDVPVLSQFLKALPGVNMDELKGSFSILPLGDDERPVPAYVVPDDAPAKKDGHDIVITLCSDECAQELRQALTESFGGPLGA